MCVIVQYALRLCDSVSARTLVNIDLELASKVHRLLLLLCLSQLLGVVDSFSLVLLLEFELFRGLLLSNARLI